MGARGKYLENGKTRKRRLSSIIRLSLERSSFSAVFQVLPSAFASDVLCDGSLCGLAGRGLFWLAVSFGLYERNVSFLNCCSMFRPIWMCGSNFMLPQAIANRTS